jgi:hypothetical protein
VLCTEHYYHAFLTFDAFLGVRSLRLRAVTTSVTVFIVRGAGRYLFTHHGTQQPRRTSSTAPLFLSFSTNKIHWPAGCRESTAHLLGQNGRPGNREAECFETTVQQPDEE